jgi:hypothetical protein
MFWFVMQCGLVGRYQRFGGTYSLYHRGWRWSLYVPPKRWHVHKSTRPYNQEDQHRVGPNLTPVELRVREDLGAYVLNIHTYNPV